MIIPFGPWLPDAPSFGNQGLGEARNVLPVAGDQPSYAPARAFVGSGADMADDVPMAIWAVRSPEGLSYQFAASASRLYRSTNSGRAFSDVSRGNAAYTSEGTPTWDATGIGNYLVATNFADEVQVFDLAGGTNFANLAAGAPRARWLVGAKNFLVLGHTEDNPQGLRWSGLDRFDYFPTIGSDEALETQSDKQDLLNDYGPVQRLMAPIAAADYLVLQEQGLVTARYVGSSEGIFAFDDIEGSRGAISGGACVRSGGLVHYWSTDGYTITDGSSFQYPGTGKVDRWVFDRLKLDDAYRIQGTVDPRRKLVFWLLPSKRTGRLDLMLVYNELSGWWTYCDGYDLACLGRSINTAQLVDDIDELVDDPVIGEILVDDPIWSGDNVPGLAGFDAAGRFGTLTGLPLEAQLMTGETRLIAGQQALVNGVTPLVDGAPALARAGSRTRLSDQIEWQGFVEQNRLGECDCRRRDAFHTFEVIVPPDADWKFAQGVAVEPIPAGRG